MYKSFTDMGVWKMAMESSVDVFNITCNLPKCEDYGLTSQIRRAANSVSANIAEGFGRMHVKEKVHFYYIAIGSATETQSHLIYGENIKYFADDKVKELIEKYRIIRHELNKIIKVLSKK